jgi:hypothetical protein
VASADAVLLHANLGGEHVLGVAVVVAVALEALAHASGGVAGATVGALGDVLVGGAADSLGDLEGLVAHAVEDLVQVLGLARNARAGVQERVTVRGALVEGDGEAVDAEVTGGVGSLGSEDLVDVSVALDHEALADLDGDGAAYSEGDTAGVDGSDAASAFLVDHAAGVTLGEGDLGSGGVGGGANRRDLVTTAVHDEDIASSAVSVGGSAEHEHASVTAASEGLEELVASLASVGSNDVGTSGTRGDAHGAEAVHEDGVVVSSASGSVNGELVGRLVEALDEAGGGLGAGVDVGGATGGAVALRRLRSGIARGGVVVLGVGVVGTAVDNIAAGTAGEGVVVAVVVFNKCDGEVVGGDSGVG